MAKKTSEERDWSEIIAEVRQKAQSEAEEAADEIRDKMKDLVEKVRAANFHEEAESFLAKIKKLAEDFSESEDGPSKPQTGRTRTEKYKYLDDDGEKWKRKARDWSDAQAEKYKKAYEKKYGK